MITVERLSALARLDEPGDALARARVEADAGDDSWQQWLTEYERGEALIVRVHVTLELCEGEPLRLTNTGVWIEKALHPPKVEQQIFELIPKDFQELAAQIGQRGHPVDRWELGEMYIHVELAQDLRRALAAGAAAEEQTPAFDVSLSEQQLGHRD